MEEEGATDHDTLILVDSVVRFRHVFLWLKFHKFDQSFKISLCQDEEGDDNSSHGGGDDDDAAANDNAETLDDPT